MTTEMVRDQAPLIPELENRKLATSDVQGIKNIRQALEALVPVR
jgi:hypothetical protein